VKDYAIRDEKGASARADLLESGGKLAPCWERKTLKREMRLRVLLTMNLASPLGA